MGKEAITIPLHNKGGKLFGGSMVPGMAISVEITKNTDPLKAGESTLVITAERTNPLELLGDSLIRRGE